MMSIYSWTSEYVSPGHPDKIADQISDTVLDYFLAIDQNAKVACETMVKGTNIYIAGEVTTNNNTSLDYTKLTNAVRETINEIGYDSNKYEFNGDNVTIYWDISPQSLEINKAVVFGDETTAGDQGIMFGFANRETPTMMPLSIFLAREFIMEAYQHRKMLNLNPDMKSQVTVKYDEHTPIHIDSVVMSMCHPEYIDLDNLRNLYMKNIYGKILHRLPKNISKLFTHETKFHINPAGTWNVGGPISDCGLTGRKIVADQYGADCQIGGGAFSGKDPSKVDRSSAYMARYMSLVILNKNPEANAIKVQLSYAIGEKYPISVRVYDPTTDIEYPMDPFTMEDLTPDSIIKRFSLKNIKYLESTRYGHFGTMNTPWELI